MRALPRRFYDRDARVVAPELLNKVLERRDGVRLRARIVEVEAYCGADDPGSHAYRGPTRRNATMFGPPGHWYVYFTYGMHWCANVVVGAPGTAQAVLLRAATPLEGIDVMRQRRPAARSDDDLLSGPARLAQAFGLDGAVDRAQAWGPAARVRILDDEVAPPTAPLVSARIGLAAGKGDELPWRWCVPGVRTSRERPGGRKPAT